MSLRYRPNSRDPWPKLLMFGVMKPAYLRDHAARWASFGFRGVLFHIGDWSQDVWAVDGDASSLGRSDRFFQEVVSCNEVGAAHGIDSNFITFAYYRELPDWFDDTAWSAKAARYEQAALFARASGCRGVAVDMEYVAHQYELHWEGNRSRSPDELRAQARARGRQLAEALLRGFPRLHLLVLPEGPTYYGPLVGEMIAGMLEALAAAEAPGGLHLLSEATYLQTDPRWLLTEPLRVENALWPYLSGRARRYWQQRCSVALGQWPLSADRELRDERGRLIRQPNDKQPNMTVEEFRRQTAACRMASKRYHWVYMHGAAWWRLGAREMARYPGSGDRVRPVRNIDDYGKITRAGLVFRDPDLARLAARVRGRDRAASAREFGSPSAWWVIGPFDNTGHRGFRHSYPPERRIDLGAAHRGFAATVRWQLQRCDSPLGEVNLRRIVSRRPWVVAYAACWVSSRRGRSVQMRLGSDDDVVLWVNGREAWRREVLRGVRLDDDIVPVSLPQGKVPLLVKICQRQGSWGFCLRVTDEAGRPASGVRFSTDPR